MTRRVAAIAFLESREGFGWIVTGSPNCSWTRRKNAAGRVIHTGDWKLDPRPIAAPPTDEARLRALASEGIPIALICDSTNALKDGMPAGHQH